MFKRMGCFPVNEEHQGQPVTTGLLIHGGSQVQNMIQNCRQINAFVKKEWVITTSYNIFFVQKDG